MKYGQWELTVPAWISCRTYLFGQEESRTYISNEKKHNYVLLEGLASDMWYMLLSGATQRDLNDWAQAKGVAGQTNEFISELAEQGLICLEEDGGQNGDTQKDGGAFYEPFGKDAESDAETHFIEEMQMWLYERGFMFSLFVELTYRCNLKCVHCYNPKDMPSVKIDFDTCKKAIDDAYELGCFRVTFSGGEATLHSHFAELVHYARSKRMSVDIFTNGQTLARDGEFYLRIMELYPYRICVSLYSTDKAVHERVTTVEGSFENTFNLIEKLRRDNANVQIKNFLLNINCGDCINVKNFAKRLGATSVADISLIPTIEGDKKTFEYMLDDDALFKLFANPQSPLYVGADYKLFNYEQRKDDSPCLGGFTGLCITPAGEVVVCVSMPLSFGNVNHISLKEIWRAAEQKNPDSALYKWRKLRVADYTQCHKEEFCKFCSFCPGMGYLENGFMKKSDVLCSQAKAKMKAYFYAKEQSGKDSF